MSEYERLSRMSADMRAKKFGVCKVHKSGADFGMGDICADCGFDIRAHPVDLRAISDDNRSVTIENKVFPLQEQVFDLLHATSTERDALRVSATELRGTLEEIMGHKGVRFEHQLWCRADKCAAGCGKLLEKGAHEAIAAINGPECGPITAANRANGAAKGRWRDEAPTCAGWYWWRKANQPIGAIIHVDELGNAWAVEIDPCALEDFEVMHLDEMTIGQWCGPIQQPTG